MNNAGVLEELQTELNVMKLMERHYAKTQLDARGVVVQAEGVGIIIMLQSVQLQKTGMEIIVHGTVEDIVLKMDAGNITINLIVAA